jgi:hypothetical protein
MSGKYPGGFVTLGAPAGYSVELNGSTDYLSSSHPAMNAAWTIEAWIYRRSSGANQCIVFLHNNGVINPFSGILFYINPSNNLVVNDGVTFINSFTNLTVPINAWTHVAIARSGGTTTGYVNGVVAGTNTFTPILVNSARIGFYFGSDPMLFNGYVSNVRVVNGTAVYTSAFTPPTQLFPVANTSLLTCQSPNIIDNSGNAVAITANGSAKVSNFTPFTGYTAGASGFQPALGAAAPGVWTLDEATNYQGTRRWPIYDPSFNQTTLMLHGNGTNGAQNNTFLDSSTNNFSITRVGNTTQGTFSPFSQAGYSMYLNGGSSLSYPVAANAQTGAIAGTRITYEFWYFCTGIQAITAYNTGIAGASPSVATNGRWTISLSGSSTVSTQQVTYYWTTSPSSALTVTNTTPLNQNQWHHVAICIDATTSASSTITIYTDGIGQTFTGRDLSSQSADPGFQQYIGSDGANQGLTGYIRDFRIVRGSLVYTSNFTPPTTPLTAIAGTVLLACQDNRFIDNSANNWTLGAVASGTPQTQPFSPYVPTVTTPVTYSNWFDGSGDYLTLPSNAAFGFGTGDFTVEAWYCFTGTIGTYQRAWWFGDDNDNAEINGSVIRVGGASQGTLITGTTTLVVNQWYHVALTRASGVYRLWLNGVQEGSSATNSYNSSARTLGIAATTGGANPITGNISNFRIVKGTALYTSAFTVPTAPLTNITNTSLLTCQSSTFVDNSSNNFTVTVAGNTQPRTSPVPFAPLVDQTTLNTAYSTTLVGGSAYFNGTSDYLSLNPSPFQTLYSTTVPFTLEVWLYPTAYPSSNISLISATTAANTNTGWWINISSAGVINWIINGVAVSAINQTAPLNRWSHYAVVWNGTTLTSYLNGSNVLSGSTTWTNNGSSNVSYIGTLLPGTYNYYYTGYLSGMRLVVGTQVYTRAFVPPSAPPTPVTNTQLLLNYTNAGIIDSTADNVLQTVGNAQISTTQSKYGGSSMYFDGTGDQIISPNNPNYFLISGNFTIECWVNLSGSAGSIANYSNGQSTNSNFSWEIYQLSASTIYFSIFEGNTQYLASSTAFSLNVWNHIAAVRNGNTLTVYVNGVAGSTTVSVANVGGNNPNGATLKLSGYNNLAGMITGYIDDFRITKGVARYTTNFTPPTSQLQDQ